MKERLPPHLPHSPSPLCVHEHGITSTLTLRGYLWYTAHSGHEDSKLGPLPKVSHELPRS